MEFLVFILVEFLNCKIKCGNIIFISRISEACLEYVRRVLESALNLGSPGDELSLA